MFLVNAFSLNMLESTDLTKVVFIDVTEAYAASTAARCESAIGHAELAGLLTAKFGFEVKANRATVKLKDGDSFLVAQYSGPRLEEGATTLPQGAEIKFILGMIGDAKCSRLAS